jgi:membrane protein implicated in regulation of membrane protease activity
MSRARQRQIRLVLVPLGTFAGLLGVATDRVWLLSVGLVALFVALVRPWVMRVEYRRRQRQSRPEDVNG